MFSESYATYTAAPAIKRRVKVTCGGEIGGGIARYWPDEEPEGDPIDEMPLDIAIGETATFSNDGSYDKDTKENGMGQLVPDTLKPVEWDLMVGEQLYEGNGSLSHTFNESGYYSATAKIDDYSPAEAQEAGIIAKANDAPRYTDASVNVLPVDYVIVLPNPYQDPNRCAPGKQIVFTGHAYNHGPDEQRCYDEYGRVIPTRDEDDIPLGATFDWSTNIGSVDPIYDSASTTFTAGENPGTGSVTATYNKCGNTKSGSAAVFVEIVTAELGGPNGGDIMNIPINAKVPESMGGTGSVGQVKGKVTIEGSPNTEYTAVLSAEWNGNGRISFPSSVGITTNGNGVGEAEFTITGQTKSSTLGDITFKVEIKYGDNVLADSEQDLTVYEIKWEKGIVRSTDTDLDTSVLVTPPPLKNPSVTSYFFYLTIPSDPNWPNKIAEGKYSWYYNGVANVRRAQTIACRPNPNEVGGGMISVRSGRDHNSTWVRAYWYCEDCEIDLFTDPENAYSGEVKISPKIRAITKFYCKVSSNWDCGGSSSVSFGIPIPYVGTISWSRNFPNICQATAISMGGMSIKFPGDTTDHREKEYHKTVVGSDWFPSPIIADYVFEVSPDVSKILQVGGDPTIFSLALKTKALVDDGGHPPFHSCAEARFFGFKHADTDVTYTGDLELFQSE